MSHESEKTVNNQTKVMWKPSPERIAASKFNQFKEFVNEKYQYNIGDYWQMYQWSITKIEEFWATVYEFSNIITKSQYEVVLEKDVKMEDVPRWFVGSTLNYSENILQKMRHCEKVAIYVRGEQEHLDLKYKDLYRMVKKVSSTYREIGIQKGDRIAAFVTNGVEAVVAMLAAATIGAVWSSCSTDFGLGAVVDRMSQIQPKLMLFSCTSIYNGKRFDHREKIGEILREIGSIETVISISEKLTDVSDKRVLNWSDIIDGYEQDDGDIYFEPVSFDWPLVILFSSGTTGKPKCLVHATGGVLLQHKKEMELILDFKDSDILFYYTTTGWMMWNWLVSGLLVGMSIVVYEGTPLGPTPSVLWDLIENLNVSVFGTSAKYLQYLEDVDYKPNTTHRFEALKTILSTASPLKPNSFEFVYANIKTDLFLGSISGGTDIVSLFVAGCSVLPVYKGEITCRCLGMAVESWDEYEKPVLDVPGDLVCTKPFPVMPVYFYNDPDKTKYKASYFSKFQGVWCQGDFVRINSTTQGLFMLGRSDGTLNPNGVRFGSSEIYNCVEGIGGIQDSLCVGQLIDQNERVILFVKLKVASKPASFYDHELDPSLKSQIVSKIRATLSPRHVPAKILLVDSIPYTNNGKKIEVAVKGILNQLYVAASKSGKTDSKEKLAYASQNVVIDHKVIVSVAEKESITQFLKIHQLVE